MKKIILFLMTIITFTNVSYASFPVIEKVSNQTTESNVPLYLMGNSTLLIWTIVGFTLYGFLFLYLRTNKDFLKNPFKLFQLSGWRRGPWLWPLYLLALSLMVFSGYLMMIWMWRGLGCMIGYC